MEIPCWTYGKVDSWYFSILNFHANTFCFGISIFYSLNSNTIKTVILHCTVIIFLKLDFDVNTLYILQFYDGLMI